MVRVFCTSSNRAGVPRRSDWISLFNLSPNPQIVTDPHSQFHSIVLEPPVSHRIRRTFRQYSYIPRSSGAPHRTMDVPAALS